MSSWKEVLDSFKDLDQSGKIMFLKEVYILEPFKYEYATLQESLSRFYDANLKRPEKEK